MICSNCGKETSDTLEKCPYCGNDLKGMQAVAAAENTMKRFCAECGAPLQDNAVFCMKCGTKSKLKPVKTEIPNTASQNVQPQLRPQSSPKTAETKSGKHRKGIVISVVSIIVLVIAFSIVSIRFYFMRQGLGGQEEEITVAEVQKVQSQQESMPSVERTQETQPALEETSQTYVVENVEENAQNEEQKTPKTIQLDSSYIRSIQASSELTDSTKTYQAEFVFDGNRETCWCEGADGTGAGEALVIKFTQPVYLTEVAFLNGYLKNETVYNNNGKIRRVELETEEGRFETEFADRKYQEIADDLYSDRFTFDEPVETQYLSVMILEAQKGAKYDDTCLTELILWGYVDDMDMPAASLEEGTYSWNSGSNEDASGAEVTLTYDAGGMLHLSGECWNSVASAVIDASAVSINSDGSVQFTGDVLLNEFDEEKKIESIALMVSSTKQGGIAVKQSGETGSVAFTGTYQPAMNILDLYESLRIQVANTYGSDCEYALYDMDRDGTVELIVSWGTCDADWTNSVYMVDGNGMLAEVGKFFGMVSLYAAENGDGIYSVYGHSGYQQVEWVTKSGDALYVETILSEETEDYYGNDSPILMVGIDQKITKD